MKHTCQLIDDDGVLVLSTIQQMTYWSEYEFDYDFPAELLDHMDEARIVAWESGGEGEHTVEIGYSTTQIQKPEKGIGPFLLRAFDHDSFVAMSYSTFTYAAACSEGKFTRPVFSFEIPKGDYHVYVSRASEHNWIVHLLPADQTPPYTCGENLPEP